MTAVAARRPTRAGRIVSYVGVLFPPLPMIVATYVTMAGGYLSLEAIALHERLAYTWRALLVGVSCVATLLLLRVYDELKDVEVDRRLAAAGDPKYLERPIVLGTIDVEDLQALRWTLVAVATAVNVALGPTMVAAFAILYVVTWCSYHWFFWPKMRQRLLIAFATHNPLTAVLHAYLAVFFATDFGWSAVRPAVVVALIVAHQGMAAAWEIARKVRAPDDETDYVTYSRALGLRGAAIAPAACVAAATAAMIGIARAADLSIAYAIVLALAALAPIVACVRFAARPDRATANLRPWVEAFTLVANVGLLVALIARWGIVAAPR